MSSSTSLCPSHACRDVILEKHYKGVTSRASVEVFWEEVNKRTKRDDVPPVLVTPKYYLVSIYRNGLYFLATLTTEVRGTAATR